AGGLRRHPGDRAPPAGVVLLHSSIHRTRREPSEVRTTPRAHAAIRKDTRRRSRGAVASSSVDPTRPGNQHRALALPTWRSKLGEPFQRVNCMNILLIRFSSLGDVILTTPLVRALRAAYPNAELHFATRPAFAPILASNPRLDRVLTLQGSDASALARFAKTLRAQHYDHVLDLHGTLRARALRVLVPGPRWRTY